MSLAPEIQWLIDRWNLPPAGPGVINVAALLEAENKGSTAVRISGEDIEWGAAASAGTAAPLVVSPDGKHLQSLRCHKAEESVAAHILELANPARDRPVSAGFADGTDPIAQLFPDAEPKDAQVRAARNALQRRLTIITGGPGTGKTHTLARILALLVTDAGLKPDFIRLAAPTGKASDRMRQSVLDSLAGMPAAARKKAPELQRIANQSRTIHSLLGYNFSTGKCRYDGRTPLACQVLIVDECSMVDLHLWKALFDALPTEARLILVGDPLQLQSVGQGNVFGDLVAYARNKESPLAASLVQLTDSWRFRERPGIHALATALERGDAKAAESLLRSAHEQPDCGVVWLETDGKAPGYAKYPEPIQNAVEEAARAGSPSEALQALDKVCILTAHKGAFVGAEAVGRSLAKKMLEQEAGPGGRLPNEPVIIRTNDPETGLRNGAVVILHTDEEGKRRAWFKSKNGTKPDAYPIGALPDHGSAWAITIHRSQGSEYDDVLVILPREESPLATRELLYTAITRAKKHVYVAGTMDAVRKAVETPAKRVTLLASALDRAVAA
jgi:exodeoxyribonuclease V alpha subunit